MGNNIGQMLYLSIKSTTLFLYANWYICGHYMLFSNEAQSFEFYITHLSTLKDGMEIINI